MDSTRQPKTGGLRGLGGLAGVTSAVVLTVGLAVPNLGAAVEIDLSGTGTFKPPSAESLARLPGESMFSSIDLASGIWSFSVRYDDSASDADPDVHVGRFPVAIRTFQITIGKTTVRLPVDQSDLTVIDGGAGFPARESIRLEARAATPYGLVRVSWIQLNQGPSSLDLRGPAGALSGDLMPVPAAMAHLVTSSPFDRFLQLRIDQPGSEAQPLFYLSSSSVSVGAVAVTTPSEGLR